MDQSMKPNTPNKSRRSTIRLLIVGVWLLAGCNDFALRPFGGLRKETNGDGPPQPAPTLAISNPPASRYEGNTGIKPTSFTPPHTLQESLLPQGQDPAAPLFEHPLRSLYQRAVLRHATMEAYTYRLKRREVVKDRSEEHTSELQS